MRSSNICKQVLYILIIFLLLIELYCCSKTISLPLDDKSISVLFTLGNSNISTLIDFSLENLTVEHESYNPKISETSVLISDQTYRTHFDIYRFIEYQDYFRSTGVKPFLINFHLKENMSLFEPSRSGFGLGLNKTKNDELFPYILKNNSLIDKIAFTISPKGDYQKRKIYFGDIPEEITNNKKYQGKCLVGNYSNIWSCNLTQIKFGNYIVDLHMNASFNNDKNFLLVHTDFYEIFVYDYLEKHFDDKSCKIRGVFYEETSLIECNCATISKLPDIEFTIGELIFIIKSSFLFSYNEKEKNRCSYKIKFNKESKTKFFFGEDFLNLFVTYFDYEERSISFFSDVVEIKIKTNKMIIMNIVFSLILFMITSNIYMLFLVYAQKYNVYKQIFKVNNEKFFGKI